MATGRAGDPKPNSSMTTRTISSAYGPGRQRYTFAYDNLDRMTSESIDLGGGQLRRRTYVYDAMDNLVRRTDRNGRHIDYAFDNLYRIVSETWRDPELTVAGEMRFSFDNEGQLLSAEDVASGSAKRLRIRPSGPGRIGVHKHRWTFGRSQRQLQGQPLADHPTRNHRYTRGLNQPLYVRWIESADTTRPDRDAGLAHKRVDFSYDSGSQFTSIVRYDGVNSTPSAEVVSSLHTYDGMGPAGRSRSCLRPAPRYTHMNGPTIRPVA